MRKTEKHRNKMRNRRMRSRRKKIKRRRNWKMRKIIRGEEEENEEV